MVKIQEEHTDLVVGIDFGMTYTGVSWANLSNDGQKHIQNWPGIPEAVESKVPTKLVYGSNGKVEKWGFLCDGPMSDDTEEVFECFKIYLSQESIDLARSHGRNPTTIAETQRLITDYLRQVYDHIQCSIKATTGSWEDIAIEFIFSIPTTWQTLSVANDFEKAIRAAGFGKKFKHKARLELTEAEAVAVHVSGTGQVRFQNGDIFLVCDAGGGTTDLGLLKVINPDPKLPRLEQVAAVTGVGIGSTVIDLAFQKIVQSRLDNNLDMKSALPQNLAHELARSIRFRTTKHNFGIRGDNNKNFTIHLDTLGLEISKFTHPGLQVENGQMIFSRAEIQTLFDDQIRLIIQRIDEQLKWMRINRRDEFVKYLCLSGGLGSSPYVRSQIKQKYAPTKMKVIEVDDPRFAVVKGLVRDRVNKLKHGLGTIVTRIARASYGVLCREIYNPLIHVNADVEIDYYNKNQKWAINQIDWLIKKGDTIDTDSARERIFAKKINPGDPRRKWDTIMIISHNDQNALPRMLKQAGALKLCTIQSDLKEVNEGEFELKNKRCWQGRRYYYAKFTVRVIIAPADLRFELWFKGVKYNRSHEPISIEWDQAGASARPSSRIDSRQNDNWECQDYYEHQ